MLKQNAQSDKLTKDNKDEVTKEDDENKRQPRKHRGNRMRNLVGEGNERRVSRARLGMHSERRNRGQQNDPLPQTEGPPGRTGTWEAGMKEQNQERRGKTLQRSADAAKGEGQAKCGKQQA